MIDDERCGNSQRVRLDATQMSGAIE